MLNFFRQLDGYPPAEPKERVERRYRIPDEYVPEVLELADKSNEDGRVGRYRLWKRLEEIYPPSKEGAWELNTRNATNIYLVSGGKE